MIELSCALVVVALIARDGFVRWLKHQDRAAYHSKRLEELDRKLNATDLRLTEFTEGKDMLVKQLAEDWRKRFAELERGNEAMRKHIDSQVAGTIAQLPATGGGFNRRSG